MTKLVPQNDDLKVEDTDTLETVLARVASRKVAAEAEVPHKTPKVIPVSPEQQKALQHVTRDLKATNLPADRRALTEEEQRELAVLGRDVKRSEKILSVAVQALKTAVFNHFDVRLEEDNDPEDLPVDQKTGHYLVAGELGVESEGLRFIRQLSPSAPDITADNLLDLYEDGFLTRQEYLKATRQTRVVDEDGLMDVIRARPEVLADIEPILTPGKVTASFHIREVKKQQDAS